MKAGTAYEPRVYSGEAERDEDGGFPFGPVEVMYPGEVASIEIEVDEDSDVARWHVLVEPAPGPWAWFLRARYRTLRSIGIVR